MHEHLASRGSQSGAGQVLTSSAGVVGVNAANTEEVRRSLLVDCADGASAGGSRRSSSAHPSLHSQAPTRHCSVTASHRSRGQSIRSVVRGHPPQGTWLVEIDNQVRMLTNVLASA
jgi:hypothetical protein